MPMRYSNCPLMYPSNYALWYSTESFPFYSSRAAENPSQSQYTHVNATIHFVAPVEDPITILQETINRGMLGQIPVVRSSLSVKEQKGESFVCLYIVPLKQF